MSEFQGTPPVESASAGNEITVADLQGQGGSGSDGPSLLEQIRTAPTQPVSGPITPADLNAPAETPAGTDAPKDAPAPPDPKPAATPPPPFDPAALPTEDADRAVAHFAGGRFKTAAELSAALTDPTALLPEGQRALLAHFNAGKPLSELGAVLQTDWQKMPALDVLRAAFNRDNADLSGQLLEDAWDDHVVGTFPRGIPADDDDSNAAQLARRDLTRAADPERAKFEAEKAKYGTLPTATSAAEQQAQQQAAEVEAAKQWLATVDAAIPQFKSLSYSYDTPAGKQTATLEVGDLSAEERQAIQDPITALVTRWQTADGKGTDPAKMMADMLRILRPEAAANLLVSQGRAAEAADTLQRQRNPSENPNQQATGSQSIMEQLRSQSPQTVGPSRN